MDNQPYYDEYISYKNKNDELRSLMNGSLYDQIYNDENTNLYLLFVTSNLLEIDQQYNQNQNLINLPDTVDNVINAVVKKRNMSYREQDDAEPRIKKTKTYPEYIYNITPFLKQYITPHKLPQFEADLNYDQILVDKLENMIEDKEYINHESTTFGKTIECWYTDNLECPVCRQKSLRRYQKDNFPAIDVVCVNHNHLFEHGVKFFQIKASAGNFTGSSSKSSIITPYFSFLDRTIHTGSYKYGKIIHNVSIFDSDFIKKILVGYICIDFVKREKYLTINKSRSFFVLPKTKVDNITKKLFTEEFTDIFIENDNTSYNYYSYIDIVNPTISFDNKNNDIVLFNERYNYVLHIPLDYIVMTKYKPIENPLKPQF
jgi:hypothetical protein